MSADVIGYIAGGVFALAATIYTVRSTRKSTATVEAVERIRADGEAYERAQTINRQIVTELQAEVSRMQMVIGDLRRQLQEERSNAAALGSTVALLQQSVAKLTQLLVEYKIPLPDWMGGQ